MIRSFLAALTVGLAFSTPASANLITNGSFEAVSGGMPSDWTVGGGGVDVVSGWNPTDGANLVDLNAFEPGSLSQIIATVIGQAYVLEFDLSGNFSTTNTTKTMDVAIEGSATQSYSFSKPVGWSTSNMFWQMNVQQYFVATDTSTTISFTSTIGALGEPNDPEGVALDAISVNAAPVPAPAALFLLALGLGAIGFSRRRTIR